MKIYNENKTQLLNLEECDEREGTLVNDFIITGMRPSLLEKVLNADGSTTATLHDSLEIKEPIMVYRLFSEAEKRRNEIMDLEKWFCVYFSIQKEQSSWQSDFVFKHDDYFNKNYTNAQEFYAQANWALERIRLLKSIEG